MKIHHALVIDKDISNHHIIENLCSENFFIDIKKSFTDSIEAFKYVIENNVDLIFIDIEMPQLNGLDFIKNTTKKVNYIIISSKKDYAYDLIGNNNVVGYILKPLKEHIFKSKVTEFVKNSRIERTIQKENSLFQKQNEIFIKYERKIIKINTTDIILIESKGDYVYIKTLCKNYIIKSTLKRIDEKLPSNEFLRVHKSYVINISKINEIQNNTIVINKEQIPLSKKLSKRLRELINII